MAIAIPERFKNKLLPAVLSLITNDAFNNGESISTYLETSPYYFEEYTLHGTRHIEAVLEYADKLIPQDDYEKLTELDISILVLGIFLHDLGMFIKPSGLNYLLSLDTKTVRNETTGKACTWKDLWDNHIYKLKHASGSELDEIFGDKEPKFDISSHEVCAVFIRKYHHEIAFHIATNGFPGFKIHDTLEKIKSKCAKLVGLLAKSHGVSLRSIKEDIDSLGYRNNLPLHVPIYYLMSILRLADLLDADGNRAPKILSDMNKFSSSRSENEWTLNQLVEDRQWPEQIDIPETLNIIAEPTNSIQYLELKSWFNDWQKELDLSWAVMGEMHGDKYKLSIRRITSNIFEQKYDFVTSAVALKVNPEIVKLLVAPLYGDNPSYGVRELLQNAIDACNERTAVDGTIGEIIVDVDTKTGIFKITDNGIGMNEDVIANYYLSAGASYRYSRQWTETFTDDKNNPKIARSGRFGVGALATFLIGNKAKVTTRHINDEKGYCFEYTTEPNLLNVERIEKPTPGTTIEIDINENAIKEFKNDAYRWGIEYATWAEWYHLITPNVIYRLNGKKSKNINIYNLKKDEDSEGWFSYKSNDYDSFHWTVENPIPSHFMCNGIHIPDEDKKIDNSLERRGYYNGVPYVSVVDKKGIFPLDLDRKTVLDTFAFEDDIVAELCKYQIAKLLVEGKDRYEDIYYIINNRGFIPKYRSFILNIDQPVYLIKIDLEIFSSKAMFSQNDVAVGFCKEIWDIRDEIYMYKSYMYKSYIPNIIRETWTNLSFEELWKELKYYPHLSNTMIHFIDNSNKLHETLEFPSSIIGENVNSVIKYVPSPIKEDENNIMFKTIQEFLPYDINGGWIPVDLKEREAMYSDTFEKLKRYIEPLRAKKEKAKK